MVVLLSKRMQIIEGYKMKFKSWFHLTMAICFGIVASKVLLVVLESVALLISFLLALLMSAGGGNINFM